MIKQGNPLLPPDSNPLEWPQIKTLRCEKTDEMGNAFLELYIPEDLAWLKGHFPGQPVVPGVVQLHWATVLAKEVFEIPASFRAVDNLKFQSVILPDRHITLDLIYKKNNASASFQYRDTETLFSEGKIKFTDGFRE